MGRRDRQLGIGRDITRRDFLNVVSIAVTTRLSPVAGRLLSPTAHLIRPHLPGCEALTTGLGRRHTR